MVDEPNQRPDDESTDGTPPAPSWWDGEQAPPRAARTQQTADETSATRETGGHDTAPLSGGGDDGTAPLSGGGDDGTGWPGGPGDAGYPGVPQPRQQRKAPWGKRALAAGTLAAVALGGGVAGAAITTQFDNGAVSTSSAVSSTAPVDISGSGHGATEHLAKVAAAVQPSVVSITVQGSGQSDEGSGVILRSDGTILTNNHVVAAAANGGSISVRFSDGRTASASIVGRDPTSDLAVIRAKGVSGLRAATLGSSSDLHVGDTVLAIGSPLGLQGSVTSGIVSALHRTVNLGPARRPQAGSPFGQRPQIRRSATVGDAIQTDAAINPGNSGGALVNDSGQVIGINTAIASLGSSLGGQSGNIGVGFAIPIDTAKTIAGQLLNGQQPQHAVLGVQITNAPNGGALIGNVVSGSAADKVGLKSGDVITKVDQTTIRSADDLAAAIQGHQPGDKVSIAFTRNGSEKTVTVSLGGAGLAS